MPRSGSSGAPTWSTGSCPGRHREPGWYRRVGRTGCPGAHPARRPPPRLRRVRRPRRRPGDELPWWVELPPGRGAGRRGLRGAGYPARGPGPPRHRALGLPDRPDPARLARRRGRPGRRAVRGRALRRRRLVGRRTLRGRLRLRSPRAAHGGGHGGLGRPARDLQPLRAQPGRPDPAVHERAHAVGRVPGPAALDRAPLADQAGAVDRPEPGRRRHGGHSASRAAGRVGGLHEGVAARGDPGGDRRLPGVRRTVGLRARGRGDTDPRVAGLRGHAVPTRGPAAAGRAPAGRGADDRGGRRAHLVVAQPSPDDSRALRGGRPLTTPAPAASAGSRPVGSRCRARQLLTSRRRSARTTDSSMYSSGWMFDDQAMIAANQTCWIISALAHSGSPGSPPANARPMSMWMVSSKARSIGTTDSWPQTRVWTRARLLAGDAVKASVSVPMRLSTLLRGVRPLIRPPSNSGPRVARARSVKAWSTRNSFDG